MSFMPFPLWVDVPSLPTFLSLGIPVLQVVAGPRVSTCSEEGFVLALTHYGDVYSWGKGYKGRLGHPSSENIRTPKLVDALASKDIKMASQVLHWFILPHRSSSKVVC